MQREVGGRGRRGNGGMGSCAALDGGIGTINVPNQFLHLLQRAGKHEDVIASQEQGGNLRQLADRGSVCVRHDLSEAIHRLVQIMHPLPFSTVNFQPLILHLFLAELGSGFALTAHAAAVRPALARLAVCSVLVAVLLEHLIGEEAPRRVIHHQVWRRGATAGGASVGIHFS